MRGLRGVIHVSDQPVVPSFGFSADTVSGGFSAAIRFTWYGQVVPTVVSPDLNVVTWSAYVTPSQYFADSAFCFFSRSMAALNCVSSSSYGFVIFRSGCVAFR